MLHHAVSGVLAKVEERGGLLPACLPPYAVAFGRILNSLTVVHLVCSRVTSGGKCLTTGQASRYAMPRMPHRTDDVQCTSSSSFLMRGFCARLSPFHSRT